MMVASFTGQKSLIRLVVPRVGVNQRLTELLDQRGVDFVGAFFAAVPQLRNS